MESKRLSLHSMRTEALQVLRNTLYYITRGYGNAYEWELQGFGMYRMYLDNDRSRRLHIWSPPDVVDNVSDIHTHPWDFTSHILWGELKNHRYREESGIVPDGLRYMKRLIKPGRDAHAIGDGVPVALMERQTETYFSGGTYAQTFDEIHRSEAPVLGTATIIERHRGGRPDEAYSYYKGEWVSAAPRVLSEEECKRMAETALSVSKRYF